MHEVLSAHDVNRQRAHAGQAVANCVLLRGCGSYLDVPSFQELHGWRAFMIAPTCIIAGLGATMQMGGASTGLVRAAPADRGRARMPPFPPWGEADVVDVPGATGDYHTNLPAKGQSAAAHIAQDQYDLGFVHVKAVDDAGHDRNVELKVRPPPFGALWSVRTGPNVRRSGSSKRSTR